MNNTKKFLLICVAAVVAITGVLAGACAKDKANDSGIDYLVLVNKENKLPDDWEEKLPLTTIKNSCGDEVSVETAAYNAYLELKRAVEEELAETDNRKIVLELDSAYRSVEAQQEIWDEFTEKYGEEYTKTYVAVPGYSEHHTGLALDLYFNIDGVDIVENEDLVQYPEIWAVIHKKLPDYGFILRYPKGRDKDTGYAYEEWHIRYLNSPEIAKEITDKGLVLEEYLAQ